MKITSKNSPVLPDWARWIAMDRDGQWWCYEAEPHQHDNGWYENEVGRCQKLDDLQDSSTSGWRDSLQSINRDKQNL